MPSTESGTSGRYASVVGKTSAFSNTIDEDMYTNRSTPRRTAAPKTALFRPLFTSVSVYASW